jgi:hypothetical protein
MSSVQRFIRQIQPDSMYFNAATVVANAATLAFDFTPSASNVVGNYPPGYVTAAGSTALATLIGQANAAGPVILRDMGKTIQAVVGANGTVLAFYRQVQLVSLLSSSVGGVQGGVNVPTAGSDYLTFYIPITVGGVAQAAAIPSHNACQM